MVALKETIWRLFERLSRELMKVIIFNVLTPVILVKKEKGMHVSGTQHRSTQIDELTSWYDQAE